MRTRSDFDDYYYDSAGAMVERWLQGIILFDAFEGDTVPGDYGVDEGNFVVDDGALRYAPGGGDALGRIPRTNVPGEADRVSFSYLTPHDAADPDGDPATVDYGPNDYLMAFIKLGQAAVAPPDDEWSFLVLTVEPARMSLAAWTGDSVFELASVESGVESLPGRWYDIQIDSTRLDQPEPTVSVYWGLRGNPLELVPGMASAAATTASDTPYLIHVPVSGANVIIRRGQLGQPLETVLVVDDARIQVIYFEARNLIFS